MGFRGNITNIALAYVCTSDASHMDTSFDSGDVIVEVEGKVVTGVKSILDAIGLEVGKEVPFRIVRDSQYMDLRLTTAPETAKGV